MIVGGKRTDGGRMMGKEGKRNMGGERRGKERRIGEYEEWNII